jgi:hypothetical protein
MKFIVDKVNKLANGCGWKLCVARFFIYLFILIVHMNRILPGDILLGFAVGWQLCGVTL